MSKLDHVWRAGSHLRISWHGEHGAERAELGEPDVQPQPWAPAKSTQHCAFPDLPACWPDSSAEPDSSSRQGKYLLFTRMGCWTMSFSFWCHPQPHHTQTNTMKIVSVLCLMTHLTCWRITLWMNPFVSWVPFPSFVPSPPLFESVFFCNDNSLFCPHAHLFILPL